MSRFVWIRRGIAALLVCVAVAPVAAQAPHEEFTNLKVLPKDIPPAELRAVMNGFTRALGVRCLYCHVGEEGKPFRHEDFAKDDKPTKLKARIMLQMTKDVNEKYLSTLDHRAEPAIKVQCVTCHRGTALPRTLQDVLKTSYDTGGVDSTVARYQALRDRFYGRATYDFGDVPLADVAGQLSGDGHPEDAARLLLLNVDMNPKSPFAKRQQANSAIALAYRKFGADSGAANYQRYKAQYGPSVVGEGMLIDIGYQLLGSNAVELAISAFKLVVAENPNSGNGFDSLGEAYAKHGDTKLAIEAYTKSLALDATNDNAKQQIEALKAKPKGKTKK